MRIFHNNTTPIPPRTSANQTTTPQQPGSGRQIGGTAAYLSPLRQDRAQQALLGQQSQNSAFMSRTTELPSRTFSYDPNANTSPRANGIRQDYQNNMVMVQSGPMLPRQLPHPGGIYDREGPLPPYRETPGAGEITISRQTVGMRSADPRASLPQSMGGYPGSGLQEWRESPADSLEPNNMDINLNVMRLAEQRISRGPLYVERMPTRPVAAHISAPIGSTDPISSPSPTVPNSAGMPVVRPEPTLALPPLRTDIQVEPHTPIWPR